MDKVADHALFCCDLEESRNVEEPDAFDVDWTPDFVDSVVAVLVQRLHLLSFCEVEVLYRGLDAVLVTPGDEVSEHKLNIGKHELTRAAKTQVVIVIPKSGVRNLGLSHPAFQLAKYFVLFR